MSAQVNSQTQDKKMFNSCLIVSRHQLLPAQQADLSSICNQIDTKPELPTDQQRLKELIQQYDAIIGVFPLPLQIQILQNNKTLIVFVMESLGVGSKEEVQSKASQYPNRTAILAPSKEGEKYRVTLYKGLKKITEIKVVDEWLVQHPS